MKITILTLFPELFDGFLKTSIVSRIIKHGLLEVKAVDIRDYALDKHRHVDDTPYGGGPGMLMKVDVLHRCLEANRQENSYVLLTSPRQKPLQQCDLQRFSRMDDLIIVCGHYEGIDQRFETYIDERVSIGDYILTGGETASLVLIDGIARLLEEGISADSLHEESYNDGLLEYPQYTKPPVYDGQAVPEVLQNGNHALIRRYNLKMSLKETMLHRPELLIDRNLTKEEKELLDEIRNEENI